MIRPKRAMWHKMCWDTFTALPRHPLARYQTPKSSCRLSGAACSLWPLPQFTCVQKSDVFVIIKENVKLNFQVRDSWTLSNLNYQNYQNNYNFSIKVNPEILCHTCHLWLPGSGTSLHCVCACVLRIHPCWQELTSPPAVLHSWD